MLVSFNDYRPRPDRIFPHALCARCHKVEKTEEVFVDTETRVYYCYKCAIVVVGEQEHSAMEGKSEFLKEQFRAVDFKVNPIPSGLLAFLDELVGQTAGDIYTRLKEPTEVMDHPARNWDSKLHPDNLSASQQDHYLSLLEQSLYP